MNKYCVIVNPVAGRGRAAQALPELVHRLSEHGLDFDVVRTERPWHAVELSQEAAARYDVVVAAGGDGTCNEVLNGLMRARRAGVYSCAMGVLCVGRGNDFAYGSGIPLDLASGSEALARDRRRTIDVGWVRGDPCPHDGRYFGNGLGIGFDAVVNSEASKLTWLGGFLSYLVGVLRTIFLYYRAPLVRIEYGERTVTLPSLMVSVMNGRRMGGGFLMAPLAEPDDGLFDLCIAGRVSRARMFALIPHFLRGTQATQEPISTDVASHVRVTAIDGVLPAQVDGEMLCLDGRELELELLPGELEIVCGGDE